MANDLNQVFLIGRLVRDPEFKTVNGTSLVNFSIACGRSYTTNNGEKRQESHFFDCEAWRNVADIIQKYTTKGKQIAIQGRLKQDTWDTPDGKKASKIRIVVESMQLLGSKMGGEQEPTSQSPQPTVEKYNPESDNHQSNQDDDDEVPF